MGYAVETISSLPFGHLIGSPLLAAIDAQAQASKVSLDFIIDVGFNPLPQAQLPAGASNSPDPLFNNITPPQGGGAPPPEYATLPVLGDVRMVQFTYTANNPDYDPVAAQPNPNANRGLPDSPANPYTVPAAFISKTISVPLLSLVPIPSFSIEYMTIDFTAKITEVITRDKTKSSDKVKNASAQASGGFGPAGSGSMKASYSNKQTSTTSTSSKYSTEMNMNISVRASQDNMPGGMQKLLEIFSGMIKSN